MKKLLKFITLLFAAFAILWLIAYLQGGLFGFRFWSWHQKLTIEITTPSGIKTASSVTEVSWDMPPTWFRIGGGGGHGEGKLKGEAVILEVEPAKYLFILLEKYSTAAAIKVFATPPIKTTDRSEYAPAMDRLSTIRETRVLPRDLYPLFVTFNDISDPASVKRVDPVNLAATFGPGYSLKTLTLSITDEPVSKGNVEKALAWWKDKALLDRIWSSLSSETQTLLGSINWITAGKQD